MSEFSVVFFNGKFDVAPTPDTPYWIAVVPIH